MADVEDQSSLETWLRNQQPNFVCVLATRAAFRVAPLLVEALHDDKAKRCASIVLPSFRMLAVASAGTVWPERASEISKSFQSSINEASNAIGEEYNAAQLGVIEYKEISEPCLDLEVDASGLGVGQSALAAIQHAVQAVIDAVDISHGITSSHAAVEAAISACMAAHSAIDGAHDYAESRAVLMDDVRVEDEPMSHIAEFWDAVGRDVQFLDTYSKQKNAYADAVKSLSENPLWFESIPVWVSRKWANFKEKLPSNEKWWVWADWYEAHLKGQSFDETIELERISIPKEDWQRGPAHVNATIAKLLEAETDPLVAAISRGFEELDMVQQTTSVDLSAHVSRIRTALPSDPHQAIGATKEMLESTMKTILVRRGCTVENNIKFPKLTSRCLKELGLVKSSSPATESEGHLRKVASSAQKIINALNEYRGCAGTGHGRAVGSEPVVTASDASLAVSAGLILAAWLLRHDKGV